MGTLTARTPCLRSFGASRFGVLLLVAMLFVGSVASSASAQQFIRADANTDGGMNLDDSVFLASYLYSEGPAPLVLDSGDVNDDGAVGPGDIVYLLAFVFLGGPFPAHPFPFPGEDLTPEPFDPQMLPNITVSIPDLSVVPGTTDLQIPVRLSSDEVLAAIEVALTFDPAAITLGSFNVSNTILGIAGTEYIQQGISNDPDEPYAWLAAIADFVTPITGHFIPGGQNLPLATLSASIPPTAQAPQVTQITFASEVASPPKRNVVVLPGGLTRRPTNEGGSIEIEVTFLRGDANHDCLFDVSDVIYTVAWLFQAGPDHPCEDAADTNNDALVNIADPIYLLNYLFQSGPAPSEPFPLPGLDPDNDALDCAEQATCVG